MEPRSRTSAPATNESPARSPRPAPGRSRRPQLAWAASIATLGVLALLVLSTPLASATTVVRHVAPYTGGTKIQVRDPVTQGCGAGLKVGVAAAFNVTSGVARAQATSQSKPCATSDSQSGYDGQMGLKGLNFKVAASGTYTMTASWTLTWNASLSMSTAAANAGAQTTVEVYLLSKVLDLTSRTNYTGSTVWVLNKDLVSAGSYAGGQTAGTWSTTVSKLPLVTGHTYAFYAIVVVDVQTAVPQGAPGGSLVVATIDMGSTGHAGYLTSLVVA